MLDVADKYVDELNQRLYNIWYDPKYMYYFCCPHRGTYSVDPNGDWNGRNFVSINSDGKIIGYIHYSICRTADYVDDFGAVNFSDDPKDKYIFGKDLRQVIDDIFLKFNHNRLEFTVVEDNPIRKTYFKLVNKYGGRIIGVKHCVIKLINGEVTNKIYFEILRSDYIAACNTIKELSDYHKKQNAKKYTYGVLEQIDQQ